MAHACIVEFPKQKRWNTDNHVPPHLDALVRPYGAVCMRKLDRIIGDQPIDHVRETGNDRHASRTERGREGKREKEKRKKYREEIEKIYLLTERFG